ncbi:hypothetical protein TSUD_387620 [Trifolium subterraneum]|uniref:F-box domain-containing protein n=1 Tax=Trifolium subterraneum TaxID=3900 RepID=A0A2Z6NJI4_TRISU|nr:hypothetical protein TSUD_387620 [Trifolium subterraneum]
MITCLPGHVIDQILSSLPIKEAVRTSVLSSRWREKWYTMPNLVFDKHCVSTTTSQNPSIFNIEFLRIVDHVLLLHSGPIIKFEISNYINVILIDIVQCILHLIGRSIKELVLDVHLDEHYKIPWCLFSCQSLQRLRLRSCWLITPTTFEGLRNLKSLELEQVTIAQDALEKLISGCLRLESLSLAGIDNVTRINVHAPNLKVFDVTGEFEDINFDNTFQLVTYLAAGIVPVKLPTPFIYLDDILLCMNFSDSKEISAALCLLRSSPNLRKLVINVALAWFEETYYSWEDIFSGPALPIQVRVVKMDNISGTILELEFIKFLLLYSPVLEKMFVRPAEHVTPELKKSLIGFERASRDAEVVWDDSS